MKKLALLILVMGCAAGAFAQNATNEKTLFERVTQIEKKNGLVQLLFEYARFF